MHVPDNGTEIIQPEPLPAPSTRLAEALPPNPPRQFPWAAVLLIAVALGGLAGVGVLAWQRGLLDGLMSQQQSAVPVVKVVNTAPVTGTEAGADTADPLDKLSEHV